MEQLIHGDSYKVLKEIKDKSVDLVIIDPPYQFECGGVGGAFGKKREIIIKNI